MVFARGERNRQADRARTATLGGHVGRNLGDMPYIMDLVLQEHFLSQHAGPFEATVTGSGAVGWVLGVTAAQFGTGSTPSSTIYADLGTGVIAGSGFMRGYSRDATLRARASFSAVDSSSAVFLGMNTGNGLASATDGLFFGIDGSVSTGYFVCTARNGGVATTAILDGTGGKATIAIDTAWHDVSIVCDSQNAEVRFYVDRRLAATITTDIPSDASDYLQPHFSAINGGTSSNRYVQCDVVILSEAAP